jgi:hypothetical protein
MAKKPAEPKTNQLLETVLALQGNPGVPQWMAKLTPDQIAQLEGLREAVKDKKVTTSLEKIRVVVCQQWGIAVTKTTFRDWMRAL